MMTDRCMLVGLVGRFAGVWRGSVCWLYGVPGTSERTTQRLVAWLLATNKPLATRPARWEAASAWNRVVSTVCHLARQACQWLPNAVPEERRLRLAVLRWLRAFPLVAMCYQRAELEKLPGLLKG